MDPKSKSGLSILLALGKKPEPKDDGDVMPPEEASSEAMPEGEDMPMMDEPEASITLPKGFKLPPGAKEGETFTTTVRGVVDGDRFIVEAIGDMPLDGGEEELQEAPEEQGAEPSPEDAQAEYEAQGNKLFRG